MPIPIRRDNPVYVCFSISEFINSMFDAIMLLKSQIHETIITTPGIRINNTFYVNFFSNYRLKCSSFTVRNNLSINLTISLINPKNNRFISGAPTTNTFNSLGSVPKHWDINFNFSRKWGLLFTIIGNYLSYLYQIFVDCIAIWNGQFCNLGVFQVQRKVPVNLLEFGLGYVCAFFIPVNCLDGNKLAYFTYAKIVMTLIVIIKLLNFIAQILL